ncbi:MAG: hypothetical protein ACR652_24590 [Methylocystis sp.]|uniref:hypothetical protein n=1 Tax=Methylocystis sp. TaxID=1911079 RepID=UPI003DA60474
MTISVLGGSWNGGVLATALCVMLLLTVAIAAGYRRESHQWKAKAQHFFDLSREHEADCDYYRSLLGWLNKHGQAPAPRYDLPMNLPISTPGNPLKLTRVLDSSLDDTATTSTLEDLVRSSGGRL